jgi:hypothetical protein
MSSEEYNYAVFPPEDDVDAFAHFMEFLKVGQIAPDPELYPLDASEPLRLSSLTRQGMTIIEFGSLT